MVCPKCAGVLFDARPLCPRCGYPILEDDRTVALAFDGEPVEVLGWGLLTILSAIFIIPLAWTLSGFGRWFCRNLHFRDGTTVGFMGEGIEILGWMGLSALLSVPHYILAKAPGDLAVEIVFAIPVLFAWVWISVSVVRWIVRRLELSSGPPLHFEGSYSGFFGYHLLIGLSTITIVGWAWVLASYYGWLADHTRGDGVAFHCRVEGWDVLWRKVLLILGSVPLLTIPWVWTWYARWLASSINMTRGASAAEED